MATFRMNGKTFRKISRVHHQEKRKYGMTIEQLQSRGDTPAEREAAIVLYTEMAEQGRNIFTGEKRE